ETWRQYFRIAESLFATAPVSAAGGAARSGASPSSAGSYDLAMLRKVAAAASLMQAIRNYGHLAVQLDPLGSPPPGADDLNASSYGLSEDDLRAIPAGALGDDRFATALESIRRKREVYSNRIGYEVWHLGTDDEREWFRQAFRDGVYVRPLDAAEKKAMLKRLNEVDGLERFLHRTFQGAKRFSIEGTDALVPMLDEVISESGKAGAREIVIGMAHRGRLNVLTNVMGKPFETLFAEFQGIHEHADEHATGDVKYHMGYEGARTVDGKQVKLRLVPNPSHLEVVNPVIEGVARALQRVPGKLYQRDEHAVVPVAIHGDAAFPGEGVVPETLNISRLNAYRTGGTIHIIVNNQVGFTTDPDDARSTRYASDLAKGFEIPIFHVNGDDASACIAAVRLACAYRAKFGKDVLIDLVGYRRHGHNETDEPAFTQPSLYAKVKAHPTVPQAWAKQLIAEGLITDEEAAAVERETSARYQEIHARFKSSLLATEQHAPWPPAPALAPRGVSTPVATERLVQINESLLAWPGDFKPVGRLATQLERRRTAMGEQGGIEWGHAEALAFGSLVMDGVSVRITGQDVERGTFSHRHAVLNDAETGRKHTPLASMPGAKGAFEIHNSALSETAVLAFEYGFSTVATDSLVLWEAQFGDFVNVAQPIIDQFIAADRAKWGLDSGVVLLLPHGYEGQGPEHSSARLERFLQLCAEGNMTVAYCSTPAQYFHLLRRQALRRGRRPLVCMQPKSMLRLPAAASKLADLANGGFQTVIDDPTASQQRDDVRRIVFCTGKLYYDLAGAPSRNPHVALVRVEELYPWPHEEIVRVMDLYPAVEQVVWAQEEPRNQGAWTYVQPRLRASAGAAVGVRYIGRPERASPAEGYKDAHDAEQARIVASVMDTGDVSAAHQSGLAGSYTPSVAQPQVAQPQVAQ
ncbi:MAG TPA: 2-oxoglutarate dehydrogenase E1 component, partial [Gemmatimonas sp.]|nr:2-oxoglutarate dehydrogenase E1 component [Gemmatimonas sp.]